MDLNSNEQDNSRKKKRKQERMMAIGILAAGVLVVCVILTVIISAIVHVVSGGKKNTETTKTVQEEQTQAIHSAEASDEVSDDTVKSDEADNVSKTETDATTQTDATAETDTDQTAETVDASDNATDNEVTDDLLDGATEQVDSEAELNKMVEEQIAGMSIEQKVGALFFVTPEQLLGKETPVTSIGNDVFEAWTKIPVSGILLDEDNLTDGDSLKTMINNLQTFSNNSLLIAVEDAGGESSPFITKKLSENVLSSEQEIGSSLGTAGAYSTGISIGSELKSYGIEVDLAPLADVSLKEGSIAQKNGFGTDMSTTTDLAKNMVKGLTDQNIYAAVKYFPSYGDCTQDGSSGPVVSQRSLDDLKGEYEPYLQSIDSGAKIVMISHVSLPKVRGDNRPASLSSEIITDIVRNEWGYDGVIMTDYMDKSCMYQKYTYAEAAVGAIEAGADIILAPKNLEKSYNGLLDAVKSGKISEERINQSLTRIYRVKFLSKVAGN